MFNRLRYYIYDYRVWLVIGLVVTAVMVVMGSEKLKQIAFWVLIGLSALLVLTLIIWIIRKIRARRAAARLNRMVEGEADRAVESAPATSRAETEALRERMLEAIKAIKSSRIGVLKGNAALYELPWYVIIGDPAAGKSSAILNSGLKFPFQDSRGSAVQGIGGTRNCDWYFTTEGIVIDTAGRYSVNNEDKQEWLTFLSLLKRNRPRAPINGIIIAANIAELSDNGSDFAIELAKNLRQRVQEVTERLEVFAPVYVVFTKADLIAGFTEFFRGMDTEERNGVWGATFPYDPKAENDALADFDAYFDELTDGLREMSLHQMAIQRGQITPGLLTLPLEFIGIKPALRTFIATLFEENPYQFKPVFRGFYFTSALQEGRSSHHASERIGRQFNLQSKPNVKDEAPSGNVSHFIKDLFRKVIFHDKQLVKQYSSPRQTRLRYTVFLSAIVGLAAMLGLWTWSYTSNKQLVDSTTRDFNQIIALQEQGVDLQTRLDALNRLQEHLERIETYRRQHFISTRLGLYQGRLIEDKIKREYFRGMEQVMLRPVTTRLEDFLKEVTTQKDQLRATADQQTQQMQQGLAVEETLYQQASPGNVNDAYNALKTYLMLSNPKYVEPAHLSHQLTIFWRDWLDSNRGQMSREETARLAEKLMTFYVAHAGDPAWPKIESKVTLINDSRAVLTQVMKGQPAIERVFSQIKARAATRFPTITVDSLIGRERNQNTITGSYAISGAFSYQAWNEYIKDAVKEAANSELNTVDWVLDAAQQSDLSVAGSPEHVSRELIERYKQEYAREWQKFVQGVGVAKFQDFNDAVVKMNRLGDTIDSPLRALLVAINQQTIWDNPGALTQQTKTDPNAGFKAWFRRVILRRMPVSSMPPMPTSTGPDGRPITGPIGKAFEGFAKLMMGNESAAPLIDGYFDRLERLRTRLNALKTEDSPGPGARRLMQATMGNEGSELTEALTLVDDQLMTGLEGTQRDILRPLLLSPVVQTLAVLVPATEEDINSIWQSQVYSPFRNGIGQRFPFRANADVDAASSDIAAIFGPMGAIADFNKDTLGTLVIQRGSMLEARRWAGIGITLSDKLRDDYAKWIGASTDTVTQDSTIFQILPSPAIGAVEYTIEIDGQTLRYRNTPPQWETFQWPNASGIPGARVTAITGDGRSIDLVNAPGAHGFNRMMQQATVQNNSAMDSSKVTWSGDGLSVSIDMRIVRRPGGGGDHSGNVDSGDWRRGYQLPERVVGSATTTP